MNQATLQPLEVLTEAWVNSKAYYNRITFPDSQKMCYISMLVSYVCILFLSKSFLIALWLVIRSQQSRNIISIKVFQLQDLHKCCIRIIILIINILLYAKHLLNIKRVYTMNISEELNLVKEERLEYSVESKAS